MAEEGIHGQILANWKIHEYTKYERTVAWYIVMGAIGAVLLVYALWTVNILFALIIIISAVIIYFSGHRQPRELDFKITEDGLEIGERFYPYKNLKKFWIIYEPPTVKHLYFETQRWLHPELSIPLGNTNPVMVRKILLKYLVEDLEQEEESSTDKLSRLLKI